MKSAPCSPPAAVSTSRWPICWQLAPMRERPSRCRSMGRAPIRQPPGSTVSARPILDSRGAANRMEARIRIASASGRRQQPTVPLTVRSCPCQATVRPTPCKSPMEASTSLSRGTARSRTGPSHKIDAASSGSTLFFAAGTRTVPYKGCPPDTVIVPVMKRPPFRK